MTGFVDLDVTIDPRELAQQSFGRMSVIWPGWEANEGNLDVVLLEEFSLMSAEAAQVAQAVAKLVFKEYGQKLLGLPVIAGTSAGTLTTWEMVDDAGYTIPVGTTVGLRVAGDQLFLFTTTQSATVPPGETTVTSVPIQAVDEGTVRNGLPAGLMTLVDPLAYVSSVVSTDVTAGGSDAESDDDYLDRLHQDLSLLTPRPILIHDFEVLARNVSGVFRAKAVDGYDPVTATYDNERMVTVIPVGIDGQPVAGPIATSLQSYLDAQREVNFIVTVIDPTYLKLVIAYQAVARPGYSIADVQARADQALTDYIDPAKWAGGDLDPPVWEAGGVVRFLEVAGVLNDVEGLDYIVPGSLTINSTSSDVSLPSPAGLPRAVGPNTTTDSQITGAVVAP